MKILYVKHNSNRAKRYQLRTIIYEENGEKLVKKEAANKEAVPHLKRMKQNRELLEASITNEKLKLVKIVDESENSLTFEYIDGKSFQKKLYECDDENLEAFIKKYENLLRNSFKSSKFDSSSMVNTQLKELFGDLDYSVLDGEVCFDGVSNADLLFSNFIQNDEYIYLIDYEWVYECTLPVGYALFRSLHYAPSAIDNNAYDKPIYREMENSFMKEIFHNSFQIYKDNYLKDVLELDHISGNHKKLEEEMVKKDKYIKYLEELTQSLRIKNRIARAVKSIGIKM